VKVEAKYERTIVLELTEAEAEVLVSLVGGLSSHTLLTRALYDGIHKLVPGRTKSFKDYFQLLDGGLWAKP
jgi:hypothetical protein